MAAGVLAFAAAGCGPRGVDVGTDSGADSVRDGTPVVVQNRGTLDVNIYAVRITERFNLGMVTTNSETTLYLPATLGPPFRDLRIFVEPIGTRATYESDPILAASGDQIEVRVVNTLEQTSVIVR